MNRAILAKSCQKNQVRQRACRDTWIGALPEYTAYIVEGGHSQCSIINNSLLRVEAGDDYQDNSIKLREAINRLPASIEHLFICDDDTFVHPQRWLAHEPYGDLECRVYTPSESEKRKRKQAKWVNGGAGYWMSRRLCELYIQECNERTSAEDILVYRLAEQHGMEIVDRPDLYGDDRYEQMPAGKVSAENSLITCHPIQPDKMVQVWEATRGL